MSVARTLIGNIPGARIAYQLARHALRWRDVVQDFTRFRRMSRRDRPALVPLWRDRLFCLHNRTPDTGSDRHYVYHTAWAMRQLVHHRPSRHVDISSSLYFVALGSAVVPMQHLDYRRPNLALSSLEVASGDLLALPFADASVDSLSCMHVIEHVGLGRYGDPLDPVGDLKAAGELTRVLAPGGRFYFVAPVGRPKVAFNGHRIYGFAAVRELFPLLDLVEWALVPDDASSGLLVNASPEQFDAQSYGCGCFVFRKPS